MGVFEDTVIRAKELIDVTGEKVGEVLMLPLMSLAKLTVVMCLAEVSSSVPCVEPITPMAPAVQLPPMRHRLLCWSGSTLVLPFW